DKLTELQDTLDEFNPKLLTLDQQITLDTLYAFIENELAGCKYTDFYEPFSPMSGLQSQIPLSLSEYDFNSEADIKDYLSLVTQSFNHVTFWIDYEKKRAEKGFFLTKYSLDNVIKQCEDFLSPAENCLIPVFNDKINAFQKLSNAQKQDYQKQHKEAITNFLLPAYELMITELSSLQGSRSSNEGLCSYKNGRDYYEYLVRSYTGSEKSIPELIKITDHEINENILQMRSLMQENPDLSSALSSYKFPYTQPEDILEHLKSSMGTDFPLITHEEYQIKHVPKSLEALLNPAFYLIPPLDNIEKEIIYINNSPDYESMELFPTLAHEGFPGHMYQMTYYRSKHPHPIRSLLGTTGYHEGWARYIEDFAYHHADLEEDVASFLSINRSYSYALYARADMGIHYEGWTFADTSSFLSDLGIQKDASYEIYNTLICDPGVYLPYYISYLEVIELKELAQEYMGDDFSLINFHDFFLSTGSTYFDILQKYMKQELDTISKN
ncbi:MAG: DUF885 domain-containing protein, partial [Lachnospiraceae bacterium]